jgi:predicted transcriptional regulator
MVRRNIPISEIIGVIYRYYYQYGIKTIARDLGLARNTVKKIIAEAKTYGLKSNLSAAELEEVITKLEHARNKTLCKTSKV